MHALRGGILPVLLAIAAFSCTPEPQWYKGNLHTHSLWSDGDQFPEIILKWYKEQGYGFVAMSDHNVLADSDRWITVTDGSRADRALEEYQRTMGAGWVDTRTDSAAGLQIRLKRFEEYASRVADTGGVPRHPR